MFFVLTSRSCVCVCTKTLVTQKGSGRCLVPCYVWVCVADGRRITKKNELKARRKRRCAGIVKKHLLTKYFAVKFLSQSFWLLKKEIVFCFGSGWHFKTTLNQIEFVSFNNCVFEPSKKIKFWLSNNTKNN